jgi:AraC-like DNA-binding protein
MLAVQSNDQVKTVERYHTLDDATNILSKTMSEHQISVEHNNEFEMQQFEMQRSQKELGPISLNCLTFSNDINIDITDCGNNYFIIFPQHNALATPQPKGTILSPGDSYSLDIKSDQPLRIIKIAGSFIERQLIQLMAYSANRTLQFKQEIWPKQGINASWHRYIDYLFNETAQPSNIFIDQTTNEEMAKVVVTGLLNSQEHNYSEELSVRHTSIVPGHVYRAERYIKENISHSIDINDIVAAADVCERTLYDAFKRFRGISPICYLKNMRLDLARQALLQSSDDIKVYTIATKFGFNHLGRFSIYYKKRFGESPSQTLKRPH